MAEFEPAYEEMGTKEGGHVEHPHDRGKQTIFGISQRWHGYLKLWITLGLYRIENPHATSAEITNYMRGLPEVIEEVREFYRRIWDALPGDNFSSQKVAAELFEQVVNLDHYRPKQWMQRCIYSLSPTITDSGEEWCDGVVLEGGATLGALLNLMVGECNQKREDQILEGMNAFQRVHYVTEMVNHPKQRSFSGGWNGRSYY